MIKRLLRKLTSLIMPEGEYITTKEANCIGRGRIKDGIKIGVWEFIYIAGTREYGKYENGEKSGIWRVITPDGIVMKGEFKNGQTYGIRDIIYPNGARETIDYSKLHSEIDKFTEEFEKKHSIN